MAERGNGGIIGPANVPTNQVATGVWNLEEQQIAKSLGAWPSDYRISRSLRFNSADSAYLNRTFGTPTSNLTWTLSLWVKLTTLSTYRTILSAGTTEIGFSNGNAIWLVAGATTNTSTAIYRDVSAWGHLVISSNGTTMNAYWNNSNVLSVAMTMSQINSGVAHTIGKYAPVGADFFDGYMTEVNFIDGQALTPSSFGQTNSDTGVWEPKPYAGSYGTNGFYLNFSDNSNTTATTLGKDYSGNGNNWTPNNFSVSAGAGNDSLVDVPTLWGTDTGVGGTVRGNYATLNPLDNGGLTLANGNLQFDRAAASWLATKATFGMSSGKWYWEITVASIGATSFAIFGIGTSASSNATYVGAGTTSWGYAGGAKYTNGSSTSYGTAFGVNDVVGVAFDADAGSLTFYNNGVSQGVAFSGLLDDTYFPMVSLFGTYSSNINFGQRPFAYTAPSGFKALCTQNLPTPTVGATAATQANKFFNPVIWTTDGSGAATVTGVGFQSDFTWWKARSNTDSHILVDVIRGSASYLSSNNTDAEGTKIGAWVTNSDGWTSSAGSVTPFQNYVGWNWKANGAGVTNTAGSITSTVSVNTTSGFSVVTYTGNASGGATIGHGLGSAPKMVIIKNRGATSDWIVGHSSLTSWGYFLKLNTTAAQASASTVWNNTAPTSTVVTLGSDGAVNGSTASMVAYCFAEVPGFSKFGSYTGNGSTDGPFVYCGFRPAYVMIKITSSTANWVVEDNTRNPYNVANLALFPNTSGAEYTVASDIGIDFLSNGFKIRGTDGAVNTTNTYIFAAFASAPQKFALAR